MDVAKQGIGKRTNPGVHFELEAAIPDAVGSRPIRRKYSSSRRFIMPELLGKTALVTGASRGIGRASALALARKGAQVLVHYGRGKAEADGVVNEIRQRGGRAQAIGADLTTAVGAHQIAK